MNDQFVHGRLPDPDKLQHTSTKTHGTTRFALVDSRQGEILWANRSFSQWLDEECESNASRFAQEFTAMLKREAANLNPGGETTLHLETSAGPLALEVFAIELAGRAVTLLVLPSPPLQEGERDTLDAITGLPDRKALETRLDRLSGQGPEGLSLSILFIDLNGFKPINDRHGHLLGDEVLALVARRLSAAVREVDFIARFGGDEFVVLVEGVDTPEKLVPLVERLRAAAEQPIEIAGGSVALSASIGIAHSSEGFSTPRALLAAADQRMYEEKRSPD